MRTAAICPTCATYINATCIIYDGDYLSATGISPLDNLQVALGKVDDTFTSLQGTTDPSVIPSFIGQYYLNTSTAELWIALSTTLPIWGKVSTLITTTSTTTSSTTSTTSTTTTAP